MTNFTEHTSDYFLKQQARALWAPFIRTLLADVMSKGGEAQTGVFLRDIGTQMARQYPLEQTDDIKALEAFMNEALTELQFGWVKVGATQTRIVIEHGAFPLPSFGNAEREEQEARLFAKLLEGLYQEWFVSLGACSEVPVNTQSVQSHGSFVFHYGH